MTANHTYRRFANPYLECADCEEFVVGWHDPQACGCGGAEGNMPCLHRAGTRSVCPSWGPVNGCVCATQIGPGFHPSPARIGGNLTGGGR